MRTNAVGIQVWKIQLVSLFAVGQFHAKKLLITPISCFLKILYYLKRTSWMYIITLVGRNQMRGKFKDKNVLKLVKYKVNNLTNNLTLKTLSYKSQHIT